MMGKIYLVIYEIINQVFMGDVSRGAPYHNYHYSFYIITKMIDDIKYFQTTEQKESTFDAILLTRSG